MTADTLSGARPARTEGSVGSPTEGPLLVAKNLVKHFTVQRTGTSNPTVLRAVDGLDLTVDRGQTLAIVGESGCGKSTTARLILRLIEATSGTVTFEGVELGGLSEKELRATRRHMQMIFQDPYASLNPRMTVGQILTEPMIVHGVPRDERKERVASLLTRVGLAASHAVRYPHEFSGGQRQRVGIARALAVSPRLIVCDEPVSALDVSVQAQVINLLQDLQGERQMAYVFIAHDLAVVRHLATRVLVMYLGKVVEEGPAATLFARPSHPYTQALLAAAPRAMPRPVRDAPPFGAMAEPRSRVILEGDVPSPLSPPSGCRFRTRCPLARERCAVDEPQLSLVENGHTVACHFWSEVETHIAPVGVHARNARLRALQTAFVQPPTVRDSLAVDRPASSAGVQP